MALESETALDNVRATEIRRQLFFRQFILLYDYEIFFLLKHTYIYILKADTWIKLLFHNRINSRYSVIRKNESNQYTSPSWFRSRSIQSHESGNSQGRKKERNERNGETTTITNLSKLGRKRYPLPRVGREALGKR